jgi:hypothetical protein
MNEILRELAHQLGTTVEYLWPTIIMKMQVDWVAETTVAAILTVIFVPLLINKLKHGDVEDDGADFALAIVYGCIGLFSSIGLGACLVSISEFLAPEAAAIQWIMETM